MTRLTSVFKDSYSKPLSGVGESSDFNTSYILLADNINAQTECRIAILLFVFIFLTIVCTDIALRYWAGKNVVWHSSTSLGLTVREYVVFVAYILFIVNFASIFTTDILLLRQTDITDIVKANLVTVPIIFLYYSLLKERNRNIISTDASGIDTTRTSKSHIYLKSSDGTVKRIFLDDILHPEYGEACNHPFSGGQGNRGRHNEENTLNAS